MKTHTSDAIDQALDAMSSLMDRFKSPDQLISALLVYDCYCLMRELQNRIVGYYQPVEDDTHNQDVTDWNAEPSDNVADYALGATYPTIPPVSYACGECNSPTTPAITQGGDPVHACTACGKCYSADNHTLQPLGATEAGEFARGIGLVEDGALTQEQARILDIISDGGCAIKHHEHFWLYERRSFHSKANENAVNAMIATGRLSPSYSAYSGGVAWVPTSEAA